MKPLFLLSLPRSGSTLVQRVLAGHPRVATAAEPWFLLPVLAATRTEGVRADYWHETAAEATRDFVHALDGGWEAWKEEVRRFAERLYERAGGSGAEYFLDKTPRYHAIAPLLLEVFPDARFLFLWRHPLAVLASCMETFRAGRFEPYHFGEDLFGGVDSLVSAWQRGDSRCHAVRFEDLVAGGEAHWRELFGFLGLEFDGSLLERFGEVRLEGRYGDPTGVERYGSVSAEPLDKWPAFVTGPLRKAWCRRYLRWIGHERMSAMGYDLDEALSELAAAPLGLPRPADAWHLGASRLAARRRRGALARADSPRPLGAPFERK